MSKQLVRMALFISWMAIIVGGSTMNASALEINLETKDIRPEEGLTTLGLYSEEHHLGPVPSNEDSAKAQKPSEEVPGGLSGGDTGQAGVDKQIRHVLEGCVTVGSPIIWGLSPDKYKLAGGNEYYVVYLPFTLHHIEGDKKYHDCLFMVDLHKSKCIAVDLFPSIVEKELLIEKKITVTPQLEFGFKSLAKVNITGESEWANKSVLLVPIIKSHGEGEDTFYWVYEAFNQQTVSSGTKQSAILLSVPKDTQEIKGTIRYSVTIMEKVFGIWEKRTARSGKYELSWDLRSCRRD